MVIMASDIARGHEYTHDDGDGKIAKDGGHAALAYNTLL